jgi:tetratricopeptide (TPR) repeat protein
MQRFRGFALRVLLLAAVLGSVGAAGAWWHHTTQPDYRLLRGQEALRRGDWDEAERFVLRLEAAGEKDRAHLLRGELYLHQRDYNRAVGEYNQLADQGALRVEAAALYGKWFLLELKRPVEAERFLRLVVAERPDHVDAHRGLATIYYDQGAWVPAVLHLLAWGNLDPNDGRPYRFMGLIYRDLDQPEQAVQSYREALRRQLKEHVADEVREELAECLVAQSHYAEALGLLEGNARAREEPRLLALRADCLWNLGRTAEALALLRPALASHPQAPELLRLRANMHLQAREPEAAAALLERAVALDGHDHASRYQLGLAYESLGRRAEAAEQRRLSQQTQDALVEMTRLVKEAAERPWDSVPRRRLAECCQRLNKPDLAARWLRAAALCPPGREGRPGG